MAKCGLRGSPTVVKRVFAPSARAEKATWVEAAEQPAQALIDAMFKRNPTLETELAQLARGTSSAQTSGA
ncbi:electron transfer flavoprotein alpha/beta subunit [Bradyrhizobium sp. LM2.9]